MNQPKNSNQFDITGHLSEVFPPQQVSEKFRKREFILKTEDQYPEHVKFQLVQDKTSLVDNLQVGARVKVDFNLRGRNFDKGGTSTNFTNLEAWRLTLVPEVETATAEASRTEPQLGGRTQPNSQL